MPSRSDPSIAGTLSPASTSVATTDPGPTSTSRAVPKVSARARWDRVCSSTSPPLALDFDSIMSNAVSRTVPPANTRVKCSERDAPALVEAGQCARHVARDVEERVWHEAEEDGRGGGDDGNRDHLGLRERVGLGRPAGHRPHAPRRHGRHLDLVAAHPHHGYD